MTVPHPTPNYLSERRKGVGRGTVITPSDPFSWAGAYLAAASGDKIHTPPDNRPCGECGGLGVCERAKDPQGRDLAHRIWSPVLGEHIWIARNRADALRAGIIREKGEAVYYLDTDDIEFIRQDPAKVTMFKKAFLSPVIQ